MKRTILMTEMIVVIALIGLLFSGCEPKTVEVHNIKSNLKMIEVDQGIFEIMNSKINAEKLYVKAYNEIAPNMQYICGTIEIPRLLKDLNRNEIYTSNVSLDVNASLQAYGFSGSMGKKDILVIAYLTKFKDYNCGTTTKRAQIGLKLYVHASNLKIKVSSPTLPVIAAAVELGLAKAEYKFETYGINPDNFYINLPSAQFTVDTYSKVISAYDNIVHSLKDSTQIDPIITDLPKLKQ